MSLSSPRRLTLIAWVVMLLSSILPLIFLREILGSDGQWLFAARMGFLAGLIAASLVWPLLRPLRGFFLILIAINLAELGMGWVSAQPFWAALFSAPGGPFVQDMFSTQMSRLGAALLVIVAMLALGWSRGRFYLVKGDLRAPIVPVPALGFPKPDPWTRFGGQFAVYITLGTLLFLFLAGRPSVDALVRAIPLLPAVLLFAAMNAFNEEVTYRSSLLGALAPVIGPRPSVGIAALFFGIGHFYGIPYGVIGVLLASFLGAILGKAMVETRGFFWAWFIHFLQDVAIFSFLAVGSIAVGGG
jgi:membrane protease YdiL (CAAX protease family)